MLDRLYTAQDLMDLEGDYELDEGRLIPVTRPQRRHGRTCAAVAHFLVEHCRVTGQAEVLSNDTGFLLQRDPDTLRGPDVAVIVTARLAGLADDGWPEGAPDLVVDVASPNQSPGELLRKAGQYLDAGAVLVWVLYPDRRTAVVYDREGGIQLLGEDGELRGEPVLPGFRCVLRELF